jgi:hypothetical protein
MSFHPPFAGAKWTRAQAGLLALGLTKTTTLHAFPSRRTVACWWISLPITVARAAVDLHHTSRAPATYRIVNAKEDQLAPLKVEHTILQVAQFHKAGGKRSVCACSPATFIRLLVLVSRILRSRV